MINDQEQENGKKQCMCATLKKRRAVGVVAMNECGCWHASSVREWCDITNGDLKKTKKLLWLECSLNVLAKNTLGIYQIPLTFCRSSTQYNSFHAVFICFHILVIPLGQVITTERHFDIHGLCQSFPFSPTTIHRTVFLLSLYKIEKVLCILLGVRTLWWWCEWDEKLYIFAGD